MPIVYAGTWLPDTCQCAIDIEGDNVHPIEFRVNTFSRIRHYELVDVEVVRNTRDDPEFKDLPEFEHYEYVYRTKERRLVDGPCGADHPNPVVGDPWNGGVFHEHHVVSRAGRELWDQNVKANPHWKTPERIPLAVKAGLLIKRHLKLHPTHQLHSEETKIQFLYDAKGVLTITCPNLSTEQKSHLQNATDAKVGRGKVLFL